jgi:hypothetical protein
VVNLVVNGVSTTSSSASSTWSGFWWDGRWHEARPSAGEDDGPPTGVREPRRPRPMAPAGAAELPRELIFT